jgi:hypothetical protein
LVRIAYIAGFGRSGTTLLARLLGEIPNFASVGEAGAYFLLGPGDPGELAIRCGCGASMAECSLWSRLPVNPRWRSLAKPFIRVRHLHRALWWRPEIHADLRAFLAAAGDFYHALAARTGTSVIVDSSKSPAFAALLTRVPGLEVYVVHMVRGLTGVVSSALRPKQYIPAMSAQRSILQWYSANLGTEFLRNRAVGFSRLRYEDLVAHPRPTLEQLACALSGRPLRCAFLSSSSFLTNGQAHIHPQHHVGGNPDKFQCGEVLLRERRSELSPAMRRLVSLAGAPLLLRYGYLSWRFNLGSIANDPLKSSVQIASGPHLGDHVID